jgi:hypothetical protein
MKYATLAEVEQAYRDDPEVHRDIWTEFTKNVETDYLLQTHRNFVERYQLGYGERAFHWMWGLLVNDLGADFKFLEIGVFQGQIVSLVKLLNRKATVYGVTPLSSEGDHYATHPKLDYLDRIKSLHNEFNLPSPVILKGHSFDPRIQRLAREAGPYDLLYVDGCHDYDVALDDLREYTPQVKRGGYVVVDDAANDLAIPDGLIPLNWKGLDDVTRATKEWSAHGNFRIVASVGHLKIFRRM